MPLGQGALGQFALGQFLQVGSVSLVGVAATAFTGTFTPTITKTAGGVAATATAGSVSGRDSPALSGVAATAAAGTLVPSESGPVLVAAVATGVAAPLAPRVSTILAGVAASGVAGAVAGGPSGAPVGVTAVGVAGGGSTPSVVVPLVGVAANAQPGLVNFGQVGLFGASASGVAGALTPAAQASLAGVFASGVPGTILTPGPTPGLVGVAAAGAAGTFSPSMFTGVAGVVATGIPGAFSFTPQTALQPAVAFGVAGSVFDQVTVFLEAAGVSAVAVASDITVPRALVGAFATGLAGVVRVQSGGGLTKIGCVINGRAYEAFIDGRATYVTIMGRDCGCDGMNTHKPEWFQQGDTWQLQGNLHYADGSPFNLNAGCSLSWGLQNDMGVVAFQLSLNAGITVLDPDAGTCLITVTPAQSIGIPVGMYVDELQATDPTGLVSTQWQGSVEVKKVFFP